MTAALQTELATAAMGALPQSGAGTRKMSTLFRIPPETKLIKCCIIANQETSNFLVALTARPATSKDGLENNSIIEFNYKNDKGSQ